MNLAFTRLRRPPLVITASATLLFLLIPGLGLIRWPRPRAQGLEQIMLISSLLQSFPAAPKRPVPKLWEGRLGSALAQQLWRLQRRSWWQFWGTHEDTAPYLALPAAGLSGELLSSLPPNSLRVGNIVVFAPNQLSRQLLGEQLQQKRRPTLGFHRHCLPQLEQGQAVIWNPAGLSVIAGPIAMFLQSFQEGCLGLSVDPGGVRWVGEAAAVKEVFPREVTRPGFANGLIQAPLPKDLLLELRGPSLKLLFEGLLSRQVIRNPLEKVYGIDKTTQTLMQSAPFRLRLRAQPRGQFQASLELQLETGTKRAQWEAVLGGLAEALNDRALQGSPSTRRTPQTKVPSLVEPPAPSQPLAPSAKDNSLHGQARLDLAQEATWWREDGVIVGGWRWIKATPGNSQLLLFLGPVPTIPLPFEEEKDQQLRLRVRPIALEALGLLPKPMPSLVKQSEQLWFQAKTVEESGQRQPLSLLTGRLQVKR